ncbi:MAG: hypothetical protein FJX46_13210 [Alphaproteobacteria bacterium]|nr:hypothetical protein [Alphaproteobacteria bacterium]
MADFWRSSGFHLLERDGQGRLRPSNDFLRAYLKRPEMAPAAEACEQERGLHAALIEDPRRAVAKDRIARLADEDARHNWTVWLDFRDRLLRAGTLEACYASLFGRGQVAVPPLFVDQLVHAILRGLLDGEDAFRARAGELFFREQNASIVDGRPLLADRELVEFRAAKGGIDLVALATRALDRQVELDVLNEDTARDYWARSDAYDMVLDMRFGGPGLDALCRLIEAWIRHFHGVAVSVQPVAQIRDQRWRWHVGLDAEATALLNALYKGEAVEDERLRRILALFRIDFADPADLSPKMRGFPVYAAYAMSDRGAVRLKPQNLLVNLPLARRS